MKLPNLPKLNLKGKPKPAAAGSAKGQPRVPRAVEDLYRDMRDRRLLIPALLLVVAIIAVPVVLGAPKEAPPAPVALSAPEGSEAVAPAVLTEQPVGVRDYRERLDELKSKNPFSSSFSFPAAGANGAGADAEPVSPVAPVAPAPAPSSGAPAPAPTVTVSPTAPSQPPASGGDESRESKILIVAPRIDVNAGRLGHLKDVADVEIGDLLPDRRKAPVVMFLGASENLKIAEFVVSSDVTETKGDGHCRPSRNRCEFLRMRDGDKQAFLYEPDGRWYVIKVTDISEKIVERRTVKDEG